MKTLNATRKREILAIVAMVTLTTFIFPMDSGIASERDRKPVLNRPVVEVVFVLDTTGSMSGLIAAAKEKIWSIANTLATAKPAPDIRMGLVGYRDRGDSYVTTVTPLTNDLDAVYANLMQYQAGGGGDTPESVNQALYEAVTRTAWLKNSRRAYQVIFLVGDAPPHMDYQNDIRYPEICQLATKRGITINTIQCGTMQATAPVWRKIAHLSEGSYFQVAQSGSAVLHKTPYDEKIATLSRKLDGTRLYYGDSDHIAEMKERGKRSDEIYKSAAPSALAQRTLFNASKSGTKNFLGDQELVQAVEDGTVADLERIKKEHLPEELRHLKPAQLKSFVDERIRTRKALRIKIAALSKERQSFIKAKVRQEKDAGASSLDAKIFACIKEQAAEAKIDYTGGPSY